MFSSKYLNLKTTKPKLNDIEISLFQKKTIKQKTYLKNLYKDFYKEFDSSLKHLNEKSKIVEIGSGGGFIKKIMPNVITSDFLKLDDLDMKFSAMKMPFGKNKIDAFIMLDVMHHISDSKIFFEEINRCLKKGGMVIMIEPANTFLSRFIYTNFHHEDFDPKSSWSFKSTSPLLSANQALPWIIFFRDRKKFLKLFPNLEIMEIKTHTPVRYLISGGFSLPQLLPSFTYPAVTLFEKLISPLNPWLGMFYTIKIKKN